MLQAEGDLRVAGRLMQPDSYYVAANLAHQATEKALKAAHWHLKAQEPPWKHGLMAIADALVPDPQDIPPSVKEALNQLAPIYEHSRYPSGDVDDPIPLDAVEAGEAQDALRAAEDVMTWVRQLLQQPPGKSAPKTS
ncbi:MAG: HEPN domain-containing protein [Chloroflexi bacterium]|nr:HEPN domain-containing protein [Chloroflexota bacterium]